MRNHRLFKTVYSCVLSASLLLSSPALAYASPAASDTEFSETGNSSEVIASSEAYGAS